MSFYRDYTYYSNQHFENALNIGWIDVRESFTKKVVDKKFVSKLVEYFDYPVNTIRDYSNPRTINFENKKYVVGYSEIRVIDEMTNKKYAVPDIILFNILELGYYPPQKFIDIVLKGDAKAESYLKYI